MNSLEQFHHALYTFEKAKKEKEITGSSEEVESPILNMDFDFPDVPPPINTRKENEKEKDKKKLKNKEPIRKIKNPKQVKPIRTEGSKRMKNNLRIDMVGYDQKPICSTRSLLNKRRKMEK